MGDGDAKQLIVLRERMHQFFNPEKPPTRNRKWQDMLTKGVIPYSLISQQLISKSCFANDRRGATSALQACLKELVNLGELREVPMQQVLQEFGTSSKAYMLVDG